MYTPDIIRLAYISMLTISDKRYIDTSINEAVKLNNGLLWDKMSYEFKLMKELMSGYSTDERAREIATEESRRVFREEFTLAIAPSIIDIVNNAVDKVMH
ncbi:MAG: hypothetical protein KGI49_00100 [Patescibacteria group bacterium]|nr:hypothetical protein [Patescibacteria group bacterium]